MKIISNISEMQKWQNDSAKIAFVPTMGGLTVGGLMPICKHCASTIKRPIRPLPSLNG
jgi:pantothenate synthetase